MGGLLTAYGLGTYCATKHALEAIAATLRDELASTGITVQTINPGPYDTGFNDRIADTTYRWCLRLKDCSPTPTLRSPNAPGGQGSTTRRTSPSSSAHTQASPQAHSRQDPECQRIAR